MPLYFLAYELHIPPTSSVPGSFLSALMVRAAGRIEASSSNYGNSNINLLSRATAAEVRSAHVLAPSAGERERGGERESEREREGEIDRERETERQTERAN